MMTDLDRNLEGYAYELERQLLQLEMRMDSFGQKPRETEKLLSNLHECILHPREQHGPDSECVFHMD